MDDKTKEALQSALGSALDKVGKGHKTTMILVESKRTHAVPDPDNEGLMKQVPTGEIIHLQAVYPENKAKQVELYLDLIKAELAE